jgi:AraC family transcriptional regulator
MSSATRTRIFESPLATVDDLRCAGARRSPAAEGFSPDYQVCLPYRGVLVWHVGGDEIVGDANQVLFVSGGEAFQVTEPMPDGYGELIVTPSLSLLSDLAGTTAPRLAAHPLFLRRSRHADASLQNLRARFQYGAAGVSQDGLAVEELLMELLRSALAANTQRLVRRGATHRLIRTAKLFLEAHSSRVVRLEDVARAVGASPAYLTDLFRRVEGLPLHKYLVQLRLAKALIELPHADDLTQLALRLGFSSHSHFTAAFRRAFDCTPSQFRTSTRAVRRKRVACAS